MFGIDRHIVLYKRSFTLSVLGIPRQLTPMNFSSFFVSLNLMVITGDLLISFSSIIWCYISL